jgi:hypothetical protein
MPKNSKNMSVSTQMQQILQMHNEQVVAYVNFFCVKDTG